MSEIAAALQSHAIPSVKIAEIQSSLDHLWQDFEQNLKRDQAVTRACMSNLIIYCQSSNSQEVLHAIPGIVHAHPARVIVLIVDAAAPGSDLEVELSGHYLELSHGWQVCGEQILLQGEADDTRRLPSITRSLLVGDLPTTLWWASRQPPPETGQFFYKLATISDQIIYDSIGWVNPTKGMQAMSRWVAAERDEYVIFNLAWRRLKPWRNLLSQELDPTINPNALQQVNQITLQHGPHALGMATLLLGWLASRMGWQVVSGKSELGQQTVWKLKAAQQTISAKVIRLPEGEALPYRLKWQWRYEHQEHALLFAYLSNHRLGLIDPQTEAMQCVIPSPALPISSLVSAQLAHRQREKLFEEALEVGNALTSVLQKH